MLTYLIQGGPVMIPIGIVSIACGALVVILWQRLQEANKSISTNQRIVEINQAINKRDWSRVLQILNQTNHPLLESWQVGFYLIVEGKSDLRDIEEAVTLEAASAIHQLESPLKKLGAFVTILTMLGFLGTILGLILSFATWERMGSHVSISQLAGGIYQAMITTAAGLIAAIPYHLCYHLFAEKFEKLALQFSKDTTDLFRKIKDSLILELPIETSETIITK